MWSHPQTGIDSIGVIEIQNRTSYTCWIYTLASDWGTPPVFCIHSHSYIEILLKNKDLFKQIQYK